MRPIKPKLSVVIRSHGPYQDNNSQRLCVHSPLTPRDFDSASIEMTSDVREFSDSLPWLLSGSTKTHELYFKTVPRVGYPKAIGCV
jgi:hypothetical protein